VQIITVVDAAKALGVSGQRIRQMLDDGSLKGRKAGRSWLINPRSLTKELEKRERPNP